MQEVQTTRERWIAAFEVSKAAFDRMDAAFDEWLAWQCEANFKAYTTANDEYQAVKAVERQAWAEYFSV